MIDYFKDFPRIDLLDLSNVVKEVVKNLLKNDYTYERIHKSLSDYQNGASSANTIRQFIHRNSTHINRENKSLQELYNFIRNDFEVFPEETKNYIISNWTVISGGEGEENPASKEEFDFAFGGFLYNWFNVSKDNINSLSKRIKDGGYNRSIVLRKSVADKDTLVKSLLLIKEIKSPRLLLYVKHIHYDRFGRLRTSRGFVVPIHRAVYMIMNVENGAGMEFFAFKNPLQEDFGRMFGFVTSINTNSTILSARIFIEPDTDDWKKIQVRINISEPFSDKFILDRLKFIDKLTCQSTYEEPLSTFDGLSFSNIIDDM